MPEAESYIKNKQTTSKSEIKGTHGADQKDTPNKLHERMQQPRHRRTPSPATQDCASDQFELYNVVAPKFRRINNQPKQRAKKKKSVLRGRTGAYTRGTRNLNWGPLFFLLTAPSLHQDKREQIDQAHNRTANSRINTQANEFNDYAVEKSLEDEAIGGAIGEIEA